MASGKDKQTDRQAKSYMLRQIVKCRDQRLVWTSERATKLEQPDGHEFRI